MLPLPLVALPATIKPALPDSVMIAVGSADKNSLPSHGVCTSGSAPAPEDGRRLAMAIRYSLLVLIG